MKIFSLFFFLLYYHNALAKLDLLSYQKSNWGFQFDTQYLYTNHNYNDSGQTESLIQGHMFHLIEEKIFVFNKLSLLHSVFGGIVIANSISDDPDFRRDHLGVQSLNVGYNYSLGEWTLDPYLHFEVEAPLKSFSYSSDEAMISDGVMGLKAGLQLIKRWKKFTTQNYVGYKYRSNGFSNLFEWSLKGYWSLRPFLVGLGINGFNSVTDDKDTPQSINRKSLLDNLNSGSYRFASINPSSTAINFFGGYKWSKSLATTLDFNSTLSGIRYSQGTTYSLSVVYTPESKTDDSTDFEYEVEDSSDDLNW